MHPLSDVMLQAVSDWPAGHIREGEQVVHTVAPVVEENEVPSVQGMHCVVPLVAE